jgi:SAM-dependent methyltransferase
MRAIKDLRGLRFPDDYIVRMFFKEGMNRRSGRVLELGCGSGSNLLLFAAFDWDVTGLDNNVDSLADARFNLEGRGALIECDLSAGELPLDGHSFDAVILPSINYYVPRSAFISLLRDCRRVVRGPGCWFYIRSRLPEDWRWGRGQQLAAGAYRLDCRETGEFGLLNVFYSAEDLSSLISQHLGHLDRRQQLFVTYDNPQSGIVVRNADVVIWGILR